MDKKSEVREQEWELALIKEDADETIQKAQFAEELIENFKNTNSGEWVQQREGWNESVERVTNWKGAKAILCCKTIMKRELFLNTNICFSIIIL